MKIIVMTDVHANLPSLEAALDAIHAEGYDALFHTGDAIAIGPHPAECLDLLLSTPRIQFVMGNHEAYFVHGLPTPQPTWMSDGEVQHQLWTHAQLDPHLRPVLAEWPFILRPDLGGVPTAFVHYGFDPDKGDWHPVIREVTAKALDAAFALPDAALVFFGHDHRASDVTGRSRFVNPGSLGCWDRPVARYCVAELDRGHFSIEHRGVPYDDAELRRAFESRRVPERNFINRAFFGGRL